MRAIGLILVLAGALILAYQGFSYVSRDASAPGAGPVQETSGRGQTIWIPRTVGGIAIAVGLLLLATRGQRGPL